MQTIYLNWKGPAGRETIDSLKPSAEYWPTPRAMRAEANRLCSEYVTAGMSVYQSSRPCANWKA